MEAKLPAHFAYSIFDKDTGQMLDYKKLINHNKKETREWWQRSSANEFGKLMKGVGRNADGMQRVKGSDTLHFIHKKDIPKGKKITYACSYYDICLQKDDINRTRMIIGGNYLQYDGKTSTEIAGLDNQNTLKQHHLHQEFKIRSSGHWALLHKLKTRLTGIHENTPQSHPTGDHRRI